VRRQRVFASRPARVEPPNLGFGTDDKRFPAARLRWRAFRHSSGVL